MNSERLAQHKNHMVSLPVTRQQLQALNARSDIKGSLRTGGFLALLTLTCSAALYCLAVSPRSSSSSCFSSTGPAGDFFPRLP